MASLRYTQHTGDLPTHAPNGAKIAVWNYDLHREAHMNHYLPPSPPTRTVTTWNEDDVAITRTLTDEEFAAWEARYAKAFAEWSRTGGTFMTFGPTVHELRVECRPDSP